MPALSQRGAPRGLRSSGPDLTVFGRNWLEGRLSKVRAALFAAITTGNVSGGASVPITAIRAGSRALLVLYSNSPLRHYPEYAFT